MRYFRCTCGYRTRIAHKLTVHLSKLVGWPAHARRSA